jgi:hypothetical protein
MSRTAPTSAWRIGAVAFAFRLTIDDHCVLEVDEVVGAVGEEGSIPVGVGEPCATCLGPIIASIFPSLWEK